MANIIFTYFYVQKIEHGIYKLQLLLYLFIG